MHWIDMRNIRHKKWQQIVILGYLSLSFPSRTQAATVVDTTRSKHTALQTVSFDQVHWRGGFWRSRTETCFESSIPSMWRMMRDGTYKPFLGHFLIAAGKAEGDYHGAKWNDGDFYKWLEGAIVANAQMPSAELTEAINVSVEAIAAAQREDGYLHTPVLVANRNGNSAVKPFQDRHAFEMYNMGHLLTTACVHYRATGDETLLTAAERAAEFLWTTFKKPTPELARNSICPSHYMGALELYRTTRNPLHLQLARTFLEMRKLVVNGGDDNQDRVPFLQQTEPVGHAVRANYLYAGATDFYTETGEEQYLSVLEQLWTEMTNKKMYITGACGSLYDGASPDGSVRQTQITRVHQSYGRNYQLPQTTAHNETCANIANLMWAWRMFLATGDAKYIDVVELALYNSILSGVSLSGTEYFYVNPLRVTEPLPTELRYPRTRQKFFTSFCCPPNLVRTIAESNSYAYAKSEDALLVNLYGQSELKTKVAGGDLTLSCKTDYPWNGQVELRILQAPEDPLALKLRIPGWADSFTLSLNGKTRLTPPVEQGYAVVDRVWKQQDVLRLELPLRPRILESHPLVEETSNQLAVMLGPVVYCLESHDLKPSVRIDEVLLPRDAKFESRYRPDLLGGVTTLHTTAIARDARDWGTQRFRQVHHEDAEKVSLELIPYYAWANRGPGEMTVWINAGN